GRCRRQGSVQEIAEVYYEHGDGRQARGTLRANDSAYLTRSGGCRAVGALTLGHDEACPSKWEENLHRGAAFVAGAELDSLRQRQFGREINGVGLPTHVALPAVTAALAAAAGFFLATECAADFCATRARVHISDTAIA